MPQKQGIQLYKYTPDYVVFDLETTGISRTFDEVVEISAVKVRRPLARLQSTALILESPQGLSPTSYFL